VLASQLIGARTSRVVRTSTPRPRPGEVLVRVEASGVCASELHDWQTGRGTPRVMGHEATGTILGLGPGVTGWRVDDRVTGLMSPAYAQLVVARAERLLPVPRGVAAEAALGEPIACLVNAARRTPVRLADRVAIIGHGFMGLGMLELVALGGASRILAIDVRDEALARALALGADDACSPERVDPADLDGEGDPGSGFDVVIEASGTQPGLDLATRLVRQHGIISIVGYHQGPARTVDMRAWNVKAIDVISAHVRRDGDRMSSMAVGLELIAAGKLDLGRLVTHRYPLAGVDEAFCDLATKPPGFVKAVILPQS
jgi:threonine dehydrogenase-like Zn-dependent dehydrogenase